MAMHVLIVSSQTLFAWGVQHLLNFLGNDDTHYHHLTFENFNSANSINSNLLVLDLTEGPQTAVKIANELKTAISPTIAFVNPGAPISIAEVKDLDLDGIIQNNAPKKLANSILNLILCGGKYLPIDHLCGHPSCQNNQSDKSTQVKQALSLRFKSLSARQIDVLYLISQGLSNKQIANALNISVATVKAHSNATFKVLNVRSRTEASLAIWAPEVEMRIEEAQLQSLANPAEVVELT